MSLPEKVIEEITKACRKKYIKKTEIDEMKQSYKCLEPFFNKNEKKQFNDMINIMSKCKIKSIDNIKLNKMKPIVINIVNKYAEEFNEEPNEDKLDDKLSVDEIEKILDGKIPKYNKYNENHPMEGVTFDTTKNKYQVKYKNINTYVTKLEDACKKIIEKINVKNSGNSGKDMLKQSFAHKNHYFVTHMDNNNCYFDIRHIISVLNLKKSSWNEKYNDFSNKISNHIFHKNEFGGYIIRELIDEQTMYELVLSSNSSFSNTFKTTIAKILVELRKNNNLEITNDDIKLKSNKQFKYADTETKQYLDNASIKYIPYNYDNEKDKEYVDILIANHKNIPWSKYDYKHVLYAFILPLRTIHGDIIIKFGYTENIQDRIKSLMSEYKCPVYIVKIKIIKGERDEKRFHKILKSRYPELVEEYIIDGKDKTELYKLHPILLLEFDNHLCDETTDISNNSIIPYVNNQKTILINQPSNNTSDTLINTSNMINDDENLLDKQILYACKSGNYEMLRLLLEIQKERTKQIEIQKPNSHTAQANLQPINKKRITKCKPRSNVIKL